MARERERRLANEEREKDKLSILPITSAVLQSLP
jgi:hypothetical protein